MPRPHSAAHFGKQRDYWWNKDFLDLMAKRWKLSSSTSLLDVGSGLAHWSRLLFRYFKRGARVVGVDLESRWVSEATSEFRRDFPNVPSTHISFVQGDATAIPLLSDAFDVVTCQTLLMHLARPKQALAEMIRSAVPGGLIICVEPNNLYNTLYLSSMTEQRSVDELADLFRFWLCYQRGKIARGNGNNSIGDLLPGMFAEAGLSDINVYMSDRAAPLFPPYESEEQSVILAQMRSWKQSGTGPWDRDDLRENIIAGGCNEAFFERALAIVEKTFGAEQELIQRQLFHAAGGGMNYLVSGRKPH